MIFTACEKDLGDDDQFVPQISISTQSLTFGYNGGEQRVEITANFEYEVTVDASWLIVVKTEEGLLVSADMHTDTAERTAHISLINDKYDILKYITIDAVQEAFIPKLDIKTKTLTFAAEGGAQGVEVTANLEYEVSESTDWLSVKRSNKGIEVITLATDVFDERTAKITISSKKYGISETITVLQEELSSDSQNVLFYTSSNGKIVTPNDNSFDENILSNKYEDGQGFIVFDAPITCIGGRAFYDCTSLTSVKIPDSVTLIGGWAFRDCISLTSITIPDSVTSIYTAVFENCTSLTSVTIPDSVTSIGGSAFQGCTSLTSITIPNSVTMIESETFSGCVGLEGVIIPDSVGYIGEHAFSGCISLASITLPNRLTSIHKGAFSGCTSLTSITIPDSVTFIDNYAFGSCTSLTSVKIPNSVAKMDSNTSYAGTFSGCVSLKSVYYKGNLSDWCKIDFLRYDSNPLCNGAKLYLNGSELTDITIPSDITEIKQCAFCGYTSLKSITIPDSVTSIGSNAFASCTSLTSATIGNGVTSIGGSAFSGCKSLTSITIPDSVTSIEYEAFSGCTSLTSVDISDLSAWCKISFVNEDANPLYYAKKLYLNGAEITELTIPSDITEIKSYTFYNYTSLTSIKIPDSVTEIGREAFYNCTSLASVYCKPTTPPAIYYFYDYGFDDTTGSFPFNKGMKIYVPRDSYDAYMQYSGYSNGQVVQKNWCMYEKYIEPYDFE